MTTMDPFATLPSASLLDVCDLLSFNPGVCNERREALAWDIYDTAVSRERSEAAMRELLGPRVFLDDLSLAEKLRWVDANRSAIAAEFCRAGSSSFGKTQSYTEIVFALAEKIDAPRYGALVEEIEDAIVSKVWKDANAKMTPAQREELNRRAQESAAKYGRTAKSQAAGFAALGAAQLSGFGVYMAGSAILGTINSALGLGLGFGAFTGLSSLISVAIGPLGWAALGVFTIAKLGAPNWKKVLPVVVLIASQRAIAQANLGSQPEALLNTLTVESPEEHKANYEEAEQIAPENEHKPATQPSKSTLKRPIPLPAAWSKEVEQTARRRYFQSEPARLESEHRSAAQPSKPPLQHPIPPPAAWPQEEKIALEGQRPLSRMDRIVFCQKPENRPLIKFAAELGYLDFLAQDLETQAAIRELFEEQRASQTLVPAAADKNLTHTQVAPNKSGAPPKAKAIKYKIKEISTLVPNIELTHRAAERLLEYERDSALYTSFLQQFRVMHDGLLADKHHVPFTSPKVFQRDAGKSGRIYYRKVSSPSIRVELIGDKATQDSDYKQLQAR